MQMASAYCSNRISLLFGPLALSGVVLLRLALGLGTEADWSGLLRYGPAVATVGIVLMVFMVFGPVLEAASPWEKGVKNLCDLFLGPVGRGLSIVAVIIGGLMAASRPSPGSSSEPAWSWAPCSSSTGWTSAAAPSAAASSRRRVAASTSAVPASGSADGR